jgi:hypothetical protein
MSPHHQRVSSITFSEPVVGNNRVESVVFESTILLEPPEQETHTDVMCVFIVSDVHQFDLEK